MLQIFILINVTFFKIMDNKKKSNWGGKRKNSGRKKEKIATNTVVIRINKNLLPIVQHIKERSKRGESVENLIQVTNNQDELKNLQSVSLKLVIARDKEHVKCVELEGKNRVLKSEKQTLKQEITLLKNKIFDCQFLTQNGIRCTRKAKITVNFQGVEIHSCYQHSKSN